VLPHVFQAGRTLPQRSGFVRNFRFSPVFSKEYNIFSENSKSKTEKINSVHLLLRKEMLYSLVNEKQHKETAL